MKLPVEPPVEPMLAKLTREMPEGDGFLYEPKWDGFRALIFRDGDDVYIQSRDKKPLARYFPEVVEAVKARFPERAVIDGEIVIASPDGLDFSALQLRLHPAESRVKKLAGEIPASFVAFDVLALGDEDLMNVPFEARRTKLEEVFAGVKPPVYLTPMTRDVDVARDWFDRFEGAGLDGVIAKAATQVYEPKKRRMLKIKHRRTVDCVLAGFRWHKNGPNELIGSFLLGLWGDDKKLHHVGITSSFKMDQRRELAIELEPLRENALEGHPWASWKEAEEAQTQQRKPGMTSRWNRGKNLSWEPLRIERVVEVAYDHMQGSRFRHASTFVRWRPDRKPASCTFGQLDVTAPHELKKIFALQD